MTENSTEIDRVALWRYAFDSWLESPLVGDRPQYDAGFKERREVDADVPRATAPHNLVLNSLVFYGAIGTAFILVFLGLVTYLAISTIRRSYEHPVLGWLTISATIGLVAFSMNAQFHNESFLTGSTLGFWLVIIRAGADRLVRTGE